MKIYAVFSLEADTDISKADILQLYPPFPSRVEAIRTFQDDFGIGTARLYSYNLDKDDEPENLFEVSGSRFKGAV